MHDGKERHQPPSLLVEYDLLDLCILCAFFGGDGRTGLGEDGDVVRHGWVRLPAQCCQIAGAGLSDTYVIEGIDYLGMSSMSDSL